MGILVIFVSVWLSGCQSQGFRVYRISEEPTNYVNMTEQQMQHFPHLKEAILTNTSIETPREEFYEFKDFLESKNTEFIQYQNEYYEIGFRFAD